MLYTCIDNNSGRNMALGSTQPLTEMSTRYISWEVQLAGAYGWQSHHLHMPIVLKYGSLNLLEPSGFVQTFNGTVVLFYLKHLWGNFGSYSGILKDSSHITQWRWKTPEDMNFPKQFTLPLFFGTGSWKVGYFPTKKEYRCLDKRNKL